MGCVVMLFRVEREKERERERKREREGEKEGDKMLKLNDFLQFFYICKR